MGTLIGWRYPTGVALNLADHTYVSCGTGGKAWGCWGGKSGGTSIVQGPASTLRADAIAGHNERAGITCYLVNGVCHQAANRVLFSSGSLVRKARGYWVSDALFGTYGRPRGALGLCKAPFHKHQTVTGDLPQCLATAGWLGEAAAGGEGEADGVRAYLETVASLYEEVRSSLLADAFSLEETKGFQLTLFVVLVEFKLGSGFSESAQGRHLHEARSRLEDARFALEAEFAANLTAVDEFTVRSNALIVHFQHEAANVLGPRYADLFELPPGDAVALGDPDVVRAAYRIQR